MTETGCSRTLRGAAAQDWHEDDQQANRLHNRCIHHEDCGDCKALNPHLDSSWNARSQR